jgi:hypothetical protein
MLKNERAHLIRGSAFGAYSLLKEMGANIRATTIQTAPHGPAVRPSSTPPNKRG